MSGVKANPFEVFAQAQTQRAEEYGRAEQMGFSQVSAERKLVKLNIMVTPEEKMALKRHALDCGLSASEVLRGLIDEAMAAWNR